MDLGRPCTEPHAKMKSLKKVPNIIHFDDFSDGVLNAYMHLGAERL